MPADLISNPAIIWRFVEIVFFAGLGWGVLKGLRKDVNGIGRKVRDQHELDAADRLRQKELENQRFLAISLILLVSEDDKFQRWKIAEKLLDSNRGGHGA